ncbi:Cytochrome c-type biogenesis protein CcmE [Micromonospora sp. MW-13]|uniref:cytochrome c maturation protein CcmE n=1 Tax=unclassified Micromonospora TaxID=2617518 RepID=UPI000E446436|nr:MULTISPECIES: cytochrome c maturation protein CcmE [unclassified Micromonospora]MCX4471646.1 cytochrome c maturation protein CcmE [Micromonospora sp. NBC_01655]RGC66749.1 Cytochrome c-type biogenesis protein CcmE [Micromonospora sp. MW-13]
MIRRRTGRATLAVVLLAAGALLVTSALRDTLTYYRTPGEVLGDPAAARERVRLGGDVVPGSLRRDGDLVVFRLAEGGHEITVEQRGAPTGTFREGEGAVVEGSLAVDGTFRSDHVVVRHGNEYAPSTSPVEPADAR